jgi:hypothetical protein
MKRLLGVILILSLLVFVLPALADDGPPGITLDCEGWTTDRDTYAPTEKVTVVGTDSAGNTIFNATYGFKKDVQSRGVYFPAGFRAWHTPPVAGSLKLEAVYEEYQCPGKDPLVVNNSDFISVNIECQWVQVRQTVGTGTCEGEEPAGAQFPTPPDDRLNWLHGDVYSVVYLRTDEFGNPAFHIYGVDANSNGYPLMTVALADLAAFLDNPPAEPTFIKSAGNVSLYANPNGYFVLLTPYDAAGNVWAYVFDGLPPTYFDAYVYNLLD